MALLRNKTILGCDATIDTISQSLSFLNRGLDMSKIFHLTLSFLLPAFCFIIPSFAQHDDPNTLPAYFNGITLDDINSLTPEQWKTLESFPLPVVVRVVFDADTEPDKYLISVGQLNSKTFPGTAKRRFFVMGELVDSDFLAKYRWECDKTPGCTFDEKTSAAFHDYKTRVDKYLSTLKNIVDIWEVGNEVNGEWADEGCVKNSDDSCFSDVKEKKDKTGIKRKSSPNPLFTARKVKYAIDEVKKIHKPIALTLIHQPECTTWSSNTMFDWARNNLKPLIDGDQIDYLLISYYEDNCDKGKKTIAPEESLKLSKKEKKSLSEDDKEQLRRNIYWTGIFKDLGTLFPRVVNTGFGEVGYSSDMKSCDSDKCSFCSKKSGNPGGVSKNLLKRYYGMKVEDAKYIGGHFWWSAQTDIFSCPTFYNDLVMRFK
jgi:hypothetical protein